MIKMWNGNVGCKSSCQNLRARASRVNEGVLRVPRCVGWLAGRDNKPYCLTCAACPAAKFADIQTAVFTSPTLQLSLKIQSKAFRPTDQGSAPFWNQILLEVYPSPSLRFTQSSLKVLTTNHEIRVWFLLISDYNSHFSGDRLVPDWSLPRSWS